MRVSALPLISFDKGEGPSCFPRSTGPGMWVAMYYGLRVAIILFLFLKFRLRHFFSDPPPTPLEGVLDLVNNRLFFGGGGHIQ